MANTFKFSTFIWIVIGLFVPLWPITLPFFWYLAYRSYKKGDTPSGRLADLQSAIELNRSGVLSDDELSQIKVKALGKI